MNATQSVSLAIGAYLALALLWPTLRTWQRTGTFPVVFHRDADAFQRVVGALMALLMIALLGWCLLLGFGGVNLDVWVGPDWLRSVGWGVCGIGSVLTVLAQHSMGRSWRVGIDERPTELVTTGLFHWMRNPIFSGMIVFLAGVVLLAPSPWSVMGFLWAVSLIALQTRLEEQHLVAVHGDTYQSYAAHTGRFFPGVGRVRPKSV